ncbi:MAG: hypothetical protein JJLCMIEE_01414 [Acidimicrobiales bacterium]|nr:hypothetical protein [Acidimicrobiales bacterium]
MAWGRDRFRVGPWHGEAHVAYISLQPESPPPSVDGVRTCMDHLVERGYTSALTSALNDTEQPAFVRAGFVPHEALYVLAHDLHDVPGEITHRLRRARRSERHEVISLDNMAFDHFWRLDQVGLDEALAATPVARFRVAVDEAVAGYAITGRAGINGYVQRLAVHPAHQRVGIGRALVVDALDWLRRRGARLALVNTQKTNAAALGLYERLGFVRQPSELTVFTVDLAPGGVT